MKDGFRSISLAARRAPSVGFVRLVAGVIQKMLRLSDHESKGARFRFLSVQRARRVISTLPMKPELWGEEWTYDVPGHDCGYHNGDERCCYFVEHR